MLRQFSKLASVVALSLAVAGCPGAPGAVKNLIRGIDASAIDDLNTALAELQQASALTGASSVVAESASFSTLSHGSTESIAATSSVVPYLAGGTLTIEVSGGVRDLNNHTKTLEYSTTARDADNAVLETATGSTFIQFPQNLTTFPITRTATRTVTVASGSQLRAPGDYTYTRSVSVNSATEVSTTESVNASLEGGQTQTASRTRTVTFSGTGSDRVLTNLSQASNGARNGRSFVTSFTVTPISGTNTGTFKGTSTLNFATDRKVDVSFDAVVEKVQEGQRPRITKFNGLTLTLYKGADKSAILEFPAFDVAPGGVATPTGTVKNAQGEEKGTFTSTLNLAKRRWAGEVEFEGGAKKTINLSPIVGAMDVATR